jgi:hypothetical protein
MHREPAAELGLLLTSARFDLVDERSGLQKDIAAKSGSAIAANCFDKRPSFS